MLLAHLVDSFQNNPDLCNLDRHTACSHVQSASELPAAGEQHLDLAAFWVEQNMSVGN